MTHQTSHYISFQIIILICLHTLLIQAHGVALDHAAHDNPDYRPLPDEVKKAGGELWCPHFEDISKDDLLRAKVLGLCVAVWTVNEPDDIDAMIDLHVDAIITDYPGRVQRQLSDRGWLWAR